MNYPTRSEIEELSFEDRLRLIGDVWDTFETDTESFQLSEEHRSILEQRLDQLEKHPESTISWEEVLQRVGKRN